MLGSAETKKHMRRIASFLSKRFTQSFYSRCRLPQPSPLNFDKGKTESYFHNLFLMQIKLPGKRIWAKFVFYTNRDRRRGSLGLECLTPILPKIKGGLKLLNQNCKDYWLFTRRPLVLSERLSSLASFSALKSKKPHFPSLLRELGSLM